MGIYQQVSFNGTAITMKEAIFGVVNLNCDLLCSLEVAECCDTNDLSKKMVVSSGRQRYLFHFNNK